MPLQDIDLKTNLPYSPHTLLSALLSIVIAMLLLPLVQMLTMPLASQMGEFGQLFQYSVIIVVVILINALFLRRFDAQDLGFVVHAIGPVVAYSLILAIVFNVIVMVAEVFNPNLANASADVFQSLHLGKTAIHDIVIITTITVFAPMWEELVFRGLVFRAMRDGLRTKLPTWLALGLAFVVSALLFTDVHGGGGQEAQLVYLFILGIMLAGAYYLTGSLLTAMLFHSLNNSYALTTGLLKNKIALSAGLSAYVCLLSPLLVFALFTAIRKLYPQRST